MRQTTGYNGNPLISKADTTHAWTPEMIEEYQKCMDDPVYFIKTYAKIISIDDGLIPFDLYDYQEDIVGAYPDNRNMMLNQSRQSGKCQTMDTMMNLRNKETGEIIQVTAEEFKELLK